MTAAFRLQCSKPEIFTDEERELLEKDGVFLEALASGARMPETAKQERFVAAVRGEAEPETPWERAWVKYQARLRWESDPANRNLDGPAAMAAEGFGGSREDIRRMRGGLYSDMKKRGR